jgi:hypothetical protein
MALPIGIDRIPITIASGTSLSAAIGLGAKVLHAIVMPAAWTAADLTFQVSIDGTSFVELIDETGNPQGGVPMDFAAQASQFIAVNPMVFRTANLIKVRSGTSALPVNQGADRILTLILRPIS